MADFILITLLSVAAMLDLFYAKIPNWIILSGLISALIIPLYSVGVSGIGKYFAGMMIPLLTGVIVFEFGVLGAGDIKLFSVIGAFLGVRGVLGSFCAAVLIGAIEGGFKIIIVERWRRYPIGRVTIRFALPILLGTLGVMFFDRIGF